MEKFLQDRTFEPNFSSFANVAGLLSPKMDWVASKTFCDGFRALLIRVRKIPSNPLKKLDLGVITNINCDDEKHISKNGLNTARAIENYPRRTL